MPEPLASMSRTWKRTAHCTRHFRNTGKPRLALTTP